MTLSSRILSSTEAAVLHHAAGGPPHNLNKPLAWRATESLRVRGLLELNEIGDVVPARKARAALDGHFAELGHRTMIRAH